MDIETIKEGQHVIYGTNGICLVESITEMAFSVGGEKKTYCILRPLADPKSVIYLPYDNELLLSRLRPVLAKQEITEILSKPLACESPWVEDKKLRAATFRELIVGNHIPTLLSLIKCLCEKRDELTAQNKKMLSADREALNTSLKAVCDEIAFALGLPQQAAEEKLREYLDITL